MTTPPTPSTPGNPEPWSQPATEFVLPTPDVLASPAETALQDGRRRRRPLFIIIAAATAVALLLGGVAYAGTRLWYGSGAQPEAATPSSVMGFVRLDLSPGYGQRLKINNLLKKFPEHSGKDASEELTEGIFDALDIDEASYRKYVKPWFADRAGVAVWVDDQQQPYALIVLAAGDEAAARTGLDGLRREGDLGSFGFAIRDGFAVVARGGPRAQEAADTASKEAQRESLADSAQFRKDVDWLPARQTALAWVDVGKMLELGPAHGTSEDLLTRQPSWMFSAMLPPGLAGLGSLGDLKGRLVVGAQATDDGVEVRFRGFDMDALAQPGSADARSTVDSLPGNSAVALSTRIGDVGDTLDGLLPERDAPDLDDEDPLKDLPPAMAEELRGQMEKSRKQFEAIGKAFSAVSGTKISVAMTKLTGDIPALAATAETTSAGNAADLAAAAKLLGDQVTVTTSGTKVEVKTKEYAADGGTLAGQALYREALEGAPKNATAVVYIDLQRLFADSDMTDQDRREAKPFKAIGLVTGTEDGDSTGLLRVVIK